MRDYLVGKVYTYRLYFLHNIIVLKNIYISYLVEKKMRKKNVRIDLFIHEEYGYK